MSFDPLEYERTGGNYGIEDDPSTSTPGLEVWGIEVDLTSAFARDLGNLVASVSRVKEQEEANLVEELPTDYMFRTNTTFDVLGWAFMYQKAKQRAGYHSVLVGPKADRDNRIVDATKHIAEYRLEGERTPSITKLHYIPEFALISTITDVSSYPHSYLLNKGSHPYSLYNDTKVASLRDSGLLERGFMFASLRAATNYLLDTNDSVRSPGLKRLLQRDAPKVLEMYECLAAEGVTPLGLEETYGIMASAVRLHIGEHPELGPLPEPLA